MNSPTKSPRSLRSLLVIWLVPLLITAAGLLLLERSTGPTDSDAPISQRPPGMVEAADATAPLTVAEVDGVRRLCSSCHAFPNPASFSKQQWQLEADKWFAFAMHAGHGLDRVVSRASVARYFQRRAPAHLVFKPPADPEASTGRLQFTRRFVSLAKVPQLPGVAHVKWARVNSESGLDCVVCDMRNGKVLLWQYDAPTEGLRPLVELDNPAHVEVVDLDQDGSRDLLVADLGEFFPRDHLEGRIVWLRGREDGDYETVVVAEGLGRVADVQAADFDGDGDLDLVSAVFGWRAVGEVLYLENQTVGDGPPVFRKIQVDGRNGAIHVPVADLNGDGRPDFVALLSQQHETIVAFLNEGAGRFRPATIFRAKDPAYGSTGIQLVDLDGDTDLDVLWTNGDLMDSGLLKPYHSVQWLENRGSFPFVHHHLAALPGVHRAVAGDLDGDGDQDVLAGAFIPDTGAAARQAAILWIEQTRPRQFVTHVLESGDCDHATLDAADYDGDGDLDFVTGYFTWNGISSSAPLNPKPGWICIWENQGRNR